MKASLKCLLKVKKTNLFKESAKSGLLSIQSKGFKHVNHLIDVMNSANVEEQQRKAKFIEYTNKVYKPSKTLTFDRNGELLLFSADNLKHSQIYLKYPYCLYNMLFPIGMYNFFVDPCKNLTLTELIYIYYLNYLD
jgi:hypothetical protein